MAGNVHTKAGDPPMMAEETPSLLRDEGTKGWIKKSGRWIVVTALIFLFLGACYAFRSKRRVATTEKDLATIQKQAPGTKTCSDGTIEVDETTVIPLDTCVTWVEVSFAPTLKTIDPNQSLWLIWPNGKRVSIEGDQRFDLPPQYRKFGAWSDKKGMLEISPKYPDGAQNATDQTVPEKLSLPGPVTYVSGVVKENDQETDTLVLLVDGAYRPFHTSGYLLKRKGWPGFVSTKDLEQGDEVQLRIKNGNVERVTLTKDIREVVNGFRPLL